MTLKMAFGQFFKGPLIKGEAMDGLVRDLNQVKLEAYLLANMYVILQLEQGRALAPVDQTFYKACLSGVSYSPRRRETGVSGLQEAVVVYQAMAGQATGHRC